MFQDAEHRERLYFKHTFMHGLFRFLKWRIFTFLNIFDYVLLFCKASKEHKLFDLDLIKKASKTTYSFNSYSLYIF